MKYFVGHKHYQMRQKGVDSYVKTKNKIVNMSM